VAAAVAVAEAATGTNPSRVFDTSGLPIRQPRFSFLELPIISMRFSALRSGRIVQSQEVCPVQGVLCLRLLI